MQTEQRVYSHFKLLRRDGKALRTGTPVSAPWRPWLCEEIWRYRGGFLFGEGTEQALFAYGCAYTLWWMLTDKRFAAVHRAAGIEERGRPVLQLPAAGEERETVLLSVPLVLSQEELFAYDLRPAAIPAGDLLSSLPLLLWRLQGIAATAGGVCLRDSLLLGDFLLWLYRAVCAGGGERCFSEGRFLLKHPLAREESGTFLAERTRVPYTGRTAGSDEAALCASACRKQKENAERGAGGQGAAFAAEAAELLWQVTARYLREERMESRAERQARAAREAPLLLAVKPFLENGGAATPAHMSELVRRMREQGVEA